MKLYSLIIYLSLFCSSFYANWSSYELASDACNCGSLLLKENAIGHAASVWTICNNGYQGYVYSGIWDGTSWSTHCLSSLSYGFNSLIHEINDNDNIIVVWNEQTSADIYYNFKLCTARWDTDQWSIFTLAENIMYYLEMKIKINNNNNIIISWIELNKNFRWAIKAAVWNGTNWNTTTFHSDVQWLEYLSLKLNDSDIGIISYMYIDDSMKYSIHTENILIQ